MLVLRALARKRPIAKEQIDYYRAEFAAIFETLENLGQQLPIHALKDFVHWDSCPVDLNLDVEERTELGIIFI